jgi:hypothetical protein
LSAEGKGTSHFVRFFATLACIFRLALVASPEKSADQALRHSSELRRLAAVPQSKLVKRMRIQLLIKLKGNYIITD